MTVPRNPWAGRAVGTVVGAAYDFVVRRPYLATPGARVLWGSDLRLLDEAIGEIAHLPCGTSVLDVPCGGGLAFRSLEDRTPGRYVAADISPSMLDRARGRAGRLGIEFAQADVRALPFADGEFDVCVSFNGLHCLPDPRAAVLEMARCADRLIGSCVVLGAGRRTDVLIGAFRRLGVFGAGLTVNELGGWLTEGGLGVESLRTSGAVAYFTASKGA